MAALPTLPLEASTWPQAANEKASAASSDPIHPAETPLAYGSLAPHIITSEEISNFSHGSPTQLVGMLVMGGFVGLLFFLITYYFVRRCFINRINRTMQRRYLDIEQSQSQSSRSSWPRAPPTYEQSMVALSPAANGVLLRPRRLSIHLAVHETATQVSFRVLDSLSRSQAALNQPIGQQNTLLHHSDSMQRVAAQRDLIIQMEREQALLRLEGHPLGGSYTKIVSEEGLQNFVREMKYTNSARKKAIAEAVASVQKPKPLRLRGGGDEEHFPGSADDIVKRIKEWIRKQKGGKNFLVQKKNEHQDSDSELAVGAKEGYLTRLLKKRAERKKELFIQSDREDTLRKLEGRPKGL